MYLTNVVTTEDEQSFVDMVDVYNVIGLDSDSLNLHLIPIEADLKWCETADILRDISIILSE